MKGEIQMPMIDSEIAVDILRDSLMNLGFYAEAVCYSDKQPDLLTNASESEIYTLFPNTGLWEDEDWIKYAKNYDAVGRIDYGDTWIPPDLYDPGIQNTIQFGFPAAQHVDIIINQPVKYNSDKVICFYSKGDYPQFSNFYLVEMGHGEKYASVEHYFQIMKALEFDPDGEALKQMDNNLACAQIKALGRKVQNFDAQVWNIRRRFIMREAVAMKFYQNPELKELLLSTGDNILAEASPRDTFWGIGYSGSNPKAYDPAQWRGKNVLGNMLMDIRADMRKPQED